MLNLLKKLNIIFLFFVVYLFSSLLLFGQKAESSSELNNDVKAINTLYNNGKWEEGRGLVEGILKKSPKDSDMRMLLGKYYLQKKQYDKARYELVKSLEYAPANVDSKHLLVTVETETKRYSSAICYINELLEVNPYWKGLWRKKIELYRIMGNHVEADRLLKRISQIYPEDNSLKKDESYVREQRIIAVQKAGKIDEAIELSKQHIQEQPKKQDSYINLIDNYIKAGDYHNALIYTERGLNTFPGNYSFIHKKLAILEHQKRYGEILSLLESQMTSKGELRTQYNYFLLEAARNAKQLDPATLYGKIFEGTPNNKEAFDYVFNDLIAKEQYEEAINCLNKHRKSVKGSKELDLKELMVYRRMGNVAKVETLTKDYFFKYPGDEDLREDYIAILIQEAKNNIVDGNVDAAVANWKKVLEYGDNESLDIAQLGLYGVYVTQKRYQEAIMILDEMLLDKPSDVNLMLKKSDLYLKEGRFDYAISIYEQVLTLSPKNDRDRLLGGYNDMLLGRVKKLRENFQLEEAQKLTERWLTIDNRNEEALLYMINISFQLKDRATMLRYAKNAENLYGDRVEFKIKLAEAMQQNSTQRNDSWEMLYDQIKLNPYHTPLLNTFIQTSEDYAKILLKEKKYDLGLSVLDSALRYNDNKELKYLKGLVFEGLKQFDSAYVYQQFYDPSIMEYDDYKNHLNYLLNRTLKNNFGISHLRARYGDEYAITSISTVEYTYYSSNASYYTGRLNYAGRIDGKGIQGQVEWFKPWNNKLSSRLDLAVSNKYFAKIAFNAVAFYAFKPSWEIEIGAGMKRLFTVQNLINGNIGITKLFDNFKLSGKLSNIMLDSEGEISYLYNLGGKAQYYLNNPKNYLLVVGSFGNSPDVEVLNNQFYNSFNVFNAMVGAGVGCSLAKNVSVNTMGTWQNFQVAQTSLTPSFRNLYNLYFQLNVAF